MFWIIVRFVFLMISAVALIILSCFIIWHVYVLIKKRNSPDRHKAQIDNLHKSFEEYLKQHALENEERIKKGEPPVPPIEW